MAGSEVEIEVQAGICGFKSIINAYTEDKQMVCFEITTECENITNLALRLDNKEPIDAYQEINKDSESIIMTTANKVLESCCEACAVPIGIFKGMQVAAGLNLPKDINISINCK